VVTNDPTLDAQTVPVYEIYVISGPQAMVATDEYAIVTVARTYSGEYD